jgi:hypothetical protein
VIDVLLLQLLLLLLLLLLLHVMTRMKQSMASLHCVLKSVAHANVVIHSSVRRHLVTRYLNFFSKN